MSNRKTIYLDDAIDAIVAWTVEDRPNEVMPTDLVDRIKTLPSADASLMQDRCKIDASSDLISRQAAIDALEKHEKSKGHNYSLFVDVVSECEEIIRNVPSAEPLTDVEQRIFLKAISREEEVCRKVDAEWGEGDEECEINLVHACHEIVRKVKGALWT